MRGARSHLPAEGDVAPPEFISKAYAPGISRQHDRGDCAHPVRARGGLMRRVTLPRADPAPPRPWVDEPPVGRHLPGLCSCPVLQPNMAHRGFTLAG